MKFKRYIGNQEVKSTSKKPDGTIVVILASEKNQRGDVRVFADGAAYEKAVRKVPVENR
jgi:hypothetical protein